MESEVSRRNDCTMVLVDARVLYELKVAVEEEITRQAQDAGLLSTRYHRAIDFPAHWRLDTEVIL